MNQHRQLGVGTIIGKQKGSVFVGVVACAAFAGHSVVQGEAVHGEVVCVAGLVLEDNPALDEFVDAATYSALVHLELFAGCGSVSSSVSGAGPSVRHYFRITFPRRTFTSQCKTSQIYSPAPRPCQSRPQWRQDDRWRSGYPPQQGL